MKTGKMIFRGVQGLENFLSFLQELPPDVLFSLWGQVPTPVGTETGLEGPGLERATRRESDTAPRPAP